MGIPTSPKTRSVEVEKGLLHVVVVVVVRCVSTMSLALFDTFVDAV